MKTAEEILATRRYHRERYAKRKAGIEGERCTQCNVVLRTNSSHAPLCSSCWAKTPEGKEYYKTKKQESRTRAKIKRLKSRSSQESASGAQSSPA